MTFKIPESFFKFKVNRQIDEEIRQTEKEIEERQERIKELKGKLKYKCPSCKKMSMLKHTAAIQHHYYVEPYSCTGGDYWVTNGVSWVCPKCDTELEPYYSERDDWQTISYYFKSKTDKHKR